MINLNGLTMDELKALNTRVVDQMRHLQRQTQVLAGTQFNLGDTVQFKSKHGFIVKGTILKINAKSIKLQSDKGLYAVSPSMLTRV